MDNKEKRVVIKFIFDDKEATQGFDNVDKSGSMMTKSIFKAQLAFEALKIGVGVAVGAVKGFISAGQEAVKTFIELSKRGGTLQDVTSGFQKNFKDSEKALNDLRKASNNTISDYDLMLTASKSAMLGVSGNSEQLAKLLEIASGRAQALGVSTTDAFSDIVTGIGRNSPLILDNLGITTQAYQQQIDALEARGVTLSDNEKKELLLQTVMNDTVSPVETATDAFEQLRVIQENLRDDIAIGLAPVFQNISDAVIPKLTAAVTTLKTIMTEWWTENKDFVIVQVQRLKDEFTGLGGSLDALINPTDEQKQAMKEMITEGLEKTVDLLVGKGDQPGLIDSFKDLSKVVSDRENLEDMKTILNGVATAIEAVTKGLKWIIDHKDEIQASYRVTAAIGTFGTSEYTNLREKLGIKDIETARKDVTGKAIGGMASGIIMVGEQGPEIVNLPQGSRVTNADDTRGAMGGTTNINITVGSIADERMIDVIVQKIENIQARRNKLANFNIS